MNISPLELNNTKDKINVDFSKIELMSVDTFGIEMLDFFNLDSLEKKNEDEFAQHISALLEAHKAASAKIDNLNSEFDKPLININKNLNNPNYKPQPEKAKDLYFLPLKSLTELPLNTLAKDKRSCFFIHLRAGTEMLMYYDALRETLYHIPCKSAVINDIKAFANSNCKKIGTYVVLEEEDKIRRDLVSSFKSESVKLKGFKEDCFHIINSGLHKFLRRFPQHPASIAMNEIINSPECRRDQPKHITVLEDKLMWQTKYLIGDLDKIFTKPVELTFRTYPYAADNCEKKYQNDGNYSLGTRQASLSQIQQINKPSVYFNSEAQRLIKENNNQPDQKNIGAHLEVIGDGNCFYYAFIYGLFLAAIVQKNQQILTDLKAGYPQIAVILECIQFLSLSEERELQTLLKKYAGQKNTTNSQQKNEDLKRLNFLQQRKANVLKYGDATFYGVINTFSEMLNRNDKDAIRFLFHQMEHNEVFYHTVVCYLRYLIYHEIKNNPERKANNLSYLEVIQVEPGYTDLTPDVALSRFLANVIQPNNTWVEQLAMPALNFIFPQVRLLSFNLGLKDIKIDNEVRKNVNYLYVQNYPANIHWKNRDPKGEIIQPVVFYDGVHYSVLIPQDVLDKINQKGLTLPEMREDALALRRKPASKPENPNDTFDETLINDLMQNFQRLDGSTPLSTLESAYLQTVTFINSIPDQKAKSSLEKISASFAQKLIPMIETMEKVAKNNPDDLIRLEPQIRALRNVAHQHLACNIAPCHETLIRSDDLITNVDNMINKNKTLNLTKSSSSKPKGKPQNNEVVSILPTCDYITKALNSPFKYTFVPEIQGASHELDKIYLHWSKENKTLTYTVSVDNKNLTGKLSDVIPEDLRKELDTAFLSKNDKSKMELLNNKWFTTLFLFIAERHEEIILPIDFTQLTLELNTAKTSLGSIAEFFSTLKTTAERGVVKPSTDIIRQKISDIEKLLAIKEPLYNMLAWEFNLNELNKNLSELKENIAVKTPSIDIPQQLADAESAISTSIGTDSTQPKTKVLEERKTRMLEVVKNLKSEWETIQEEQKKYEEELRRQQEALNSKPVPEKPVINIKPGPRQPDPVKQPDQAKTPGNNTQQTNYYSPIDQKAGKKSKSNLGKKNVQPSLISGQANNAVIPDLSLPKQNLSLAQLSQCIKSNQWKKLGTGFLWFYSKTPEGIKKMQEVLNDPKLSDADKLTKLKGIAKNKLTHPTFFRKKATAELYEIISKLDNDMTADKDVENFLNQFNKP